MSILAHSGFLIMAKNLLTWPPGATPTRFNILCRSKFCIATPCPKCVHTDVDCCCKKVGCRCLEPPCTVGTTGASKIKCGSTVITTDLLISTGETCQNLADTCQAGITIDPECICISQGTYVEPGGGDLILICSDNPPTSSVWNISYTMFCPTTAKNSCDIVLCVIAYQEGEPPTTLYFLRNPTHVNEVLGKYWFEDDIILPSCDCSPIEYIRFAICEDDNTIVDPTTDEACPITSSSFSLMSRASSYLANRVSSPPENIDNIPEEVNNWLNAEVTT